MLERARLSQIRFAARLIKVLSRFGIGKSIIFSCPLGRIGRVVTDAVFGYAQVFKTLSEAEAAVLAYSNEGHEHLDNVELHLGLSMTARPSDYAALFHLAPEAANARMIFDLGGNVGNLFYCYQKYLEFDKGLVWNVYDLPRNIERGLTLAHQRGTTNLRFTDCWADASGAEILIASGSLHYFSKSLPQLVEELPDKPHRILINRTPLTDQPSVAVVQDAGSFRVACMLYNRAALIHDFARLGYTLVDAWQAAELSLEVPGSPDHRISAYSGLWFKLGS